MPVLTTEQLSALARTGAGNNEIEAILRRSMTPDERQSVLAARAMWKADRAVKRSKTKLASSDRQRMQDRTLSRVDLLPCADQDRRARLELDPVAWLRFYMAETYTRPFERPHLEIIDGVMKAHATHGRFCVAAERGIGKSAILWGMMLFLKLSGRQQYPVCVPWAAAALKRAFRFWKSALCFNPELLADYPEFCTPFASAKGIAQRVITRTCGNGWERFGLKMDDPCGCQLTVGEGMIVLPARLGCIGGSTINGNIRGLNHPQDDGTVLRPSIVLLDDVQDRQTAKSVVQVAETCAIIDGDVAGCGDAGRDMPMLMACNCIAAGDVSEHYLKHPEWQALRVPCIVEWPEGWFDTKSQCRKLWEEWHDLFLDESEGADDKAFYSANRDVMTRGMVLSAPSAFDGSDGCPDAFYGVMRMYYRMGHLSFMAERQQSPLTMEATATLVVQPEQITARAVGPVRGEAPEGTLKIVAGADINPGSTSRLGPRVTWAVMAVSRGQVAAVIAYGRETIHMPADPTQAQSAAACFAAIEVVRAKAGGFGADVMFYDARGQWAPRGIAIRYAMQRTPGIQLIPAEGWGNEQYRPTHKTAVRTFEGGHESADVVDGVRVRWVAWNADHWQETALRAWLAAPGAPGSCIIHSGDHDPEFATQCSMKRLAGKLTTSKGIRYDWADRVGDQDYGDAIGMCWAAAAWGGIGTGGQVVKKEKPKANIPMMRPSFRR